MAKSKSIKKQKFSGVQMLLVALSFGVVGGFIGWAAFAAPHKPRGSGTIAGPYMVLDLNHDGLPNHRDEVTYKVSTTASSTPEVHTKCYQGTNFVLDGYTGYFNSSIQGPNLTLDSSYWNPTLAAKCTADLFYYDHHGRQIVLASLSYTVNP